jgi:hypothetical protein
MIACKKRREEIPNPGTVPASRWPAYPDLVIPPIQKDFDVWATRTGCLLERALATVLKPLQCRLDVFAGAQAVDAVVGAVAAVDGFRKRANLHMIGLSAAGAGPVAPIKCIIRRL